ncbi:MAG TPA: outer membrane beta-barrel protein [Thermoanaerobaculia bacterium]|nr:outer membrane beta-barrel protein [Thermoanaerobaculia bacterium]
MKRVLGIVAVMFVLASAAGAADFKLYGSYWNTADVEETFGGGIGVGIPLGASPLSLSLAATYYQELDDDPVSAIFDDDDPVFQEESLKVVPLEAGLQFNFAPNGPFDAWIEGGFTYFLLDTTRNNFNVDDETGWHASVGSRFGSREGANFFASALYRSTEATLVRERNDNVDLRDEVAIDLDGFAVNAGILWTW